MHCVFHGIRFKVNEDWVSGKIPFFFCVCIPSFFFCPNKRKTKQKENSPSAFFSLLQYFSPLTKKNSLRSNSFLFLTLQKALPLNGKKMRTDLYLLWGGLTLLRSFLGMRSKRIIASFVKVDYSNERSDVYLMRFRPLVEEREEFFALSREEEKAV